MQAPMPICSPFSPLKLIETIAQLDGAHGAVMADELLESTQFDPARGARCRPCCTIWGACTKSATMPCRKWWRAHHETLFCLPWLPSTKTTIRAYIIVRVGFMAEALALYLGHSAGVGCAAAQGCAHARRGQRSAFLTVF